MGFRWYIIRFIWNHRGSLYQIYKEKGATKTISEEVFDWNVGFFKKAGYNVAGQLPDFPKGHTFCIIEKDL